ncbi:MAG: hypothetical protein VB814_08380, partial [Pirellulaceae bacterium]
PEARFAMVHCYGGYSTNLPLEILLDDDVLFAYAHDGEERLTAMVREEMMSAVVLSVPLKVDICVGDNWAECK